MEKLIELLNEFLKKEDKSIYTFYWNQVFNCIHRGNGERCDKEWICSKSFGFIKWLVENDKINFDNRDLKDRFMNEFERYPQFQNNTTNREFNINGLLMLLSIEDNPIEFLCDILKD